MHAVDAIVAHEDADLDGIRIHYVTSGSGPLVVLLHGFPDFWFGWREQIPALARAGFRVVAPDLRGYDLSAKPRAIAAYTVDRIVDDVTNLFRHLSVEHAAIVG